MAEKVPRNNKGELQTKEFKEMTEWSAVILQTWCVYDLV